MLDSTGAPGWTVVLNRVDGSVDFNRTYKEYLEGFGNPEGEVWIGEVWIDKIFLGGV